MAFFSDIDQVTTTTRRRAPRCGACGLYRKCSSPKLEVAGEGAREILVVVPGLTPDDAGRGRWLSDEYGRRISQELSAVGISLTRDCWVTGATICSKAGGEMPTPDEIDHCRPHLRATMDRLQPVAVLLMGSASIASFVQMDWKASANPQTSTWAGEVIPSHQWNAWVLPTHHPGQFKEDRGEDMLRYTLRESLRQLALHTERPWPAGPPVFADMVECLYNEDEAAEAVRWFLDAPALALDYECTGLKPEQEHSEIVSVSLSSGHRTIAAPFLPGVREALREVLRSPVPKVAANMKFEERWTIAKYGHGVRNWVYDTMQAAHWISSRPSVTSLKFQSYVLLGQPDYDSHLKHMLEAEYATACNRVKQIPLKELLVYNGLDSLLELLVAAEQMRITNYPAPWEDNFDEYRPARPGSHQ